jgi:hypothetical protein
VVAVRDWLVAVSVNVTVAFATTAPVASVTVPDNAPVLADWARTAETLASSKHDTANHVSVDFILPPP